MLMWFIPLILVLLAFAPFVPSLYRATRARMRTIQLTMQIDDLKREARQQCSSAIQETLDKATTFLVNAELKLRNGNWYLAWREANVGIAHIKAYHKLANAQTK